MCHIMVTPEETSVVLMLEVCAGEAAELLCARLGVSSGKTVLAEKVSGVVLSPGKPAIRGVVMPRADMDVVSELKQSNELSDIPTTV